jgi:hypothetical protein
MAAWSPTAEGFRSIFRKPALPLAEVLWRWSFGGAALILAGLGILEYLHTLPVSHTDLFMLRTGHPVLVSNALSHIARGSGFRLAAAFLVSLTALAILWILLASIGRAATLEVLIGHIRTRAHAVLQSAPGASTDVLPEFGEAVRGHSKWRFRSLAGLHFLRAALALAAFGGCLGALILSGFASTKTDPHPAIVFFLAIFLVMLVWMAWSSVSWLLSLASIFVVGHGQDTFGALSSSVGLCRDRLGPVAAVGTWFGLIHIVLFILATSVVTFPFAFAPILPFSLVLTTVLLLTLAYFAVVDALYIARMAGYVAILETPPIPAVSISSAGLVISSHQSALSTPPSTAMVDQDELIVSDIVPTVSLTADDPALASPVRASQVDQDERILSDVHDESATGETSGEKEARGHEPEAK